MALSRNSDEWYTFLPQVAQRLNTPMRGGWSWSLDCRFIESKPMPTRIIGTAACS